MGPAATGRGPPPAPLVAFRAAVTALRRGELEVAEAEYRRALALRPDFAQARHDLGRLLQALGRLDEARGEIEAAIAQAPGRGEYYRSLSELVVFAADDQRLAAMEALAGRAERLALVDQISIRFALGKAYGDLGRPAEGFVEYQQGCALVRRHAPYDEAGHLAMMDDMARIFTADLLAELAGVGDPDPAPIFILGMPRSGSTLVEQVLAGHPAIAAGGELTALRDVAAQGLGRPDRVRDLGRDGLAALGGLYLRTLRARHPGAARITDKMPANFMLIGLIRLLLPQARIIHTLRDPVDTCLSCFTTLFDDGQAYSYDLGELGRYHRAYRRLMDHWRAVLPAGVMLEVRYEDVVADLPGQARLMLDHCGLDWDAACLDFTRARRPVWTASAAQVRAPLHTASVGRWRPPPQVLRPLIEGLGDGD